MLFSLSYRGVAHSISCQRSLNKIIPTHNIEKNLLFVQSAMNMLQLIKSLSELLCVDGPDERALTLTFSSRYVCLVL